MQVALMGLLMGCGSPALGGDLWMELEEADGGERVRIHLPANWLADEEEPVEVQTSSGTVDLRAEARALKRKRVGASRSYRLADDGEDVDLKLSHRARSGPPADAVSLAVLGPKGRGLTLSFPMEPEKLEKPSASLGGSLTVEGLELRLDEPVCTQLRASGPVVLLEVVGADGNTVRIATE